MNVGPVHQKKKKKKERRPKAQINYFIQIGLSLTHFLDRVARLTHPMESLLRLFFFDLVPCIFIISFQLLPIHLIKN